jgi:hypothetical protein
MEPEEDKNLPLPESNTDSNQSDEPEEIGSDGISKRRKKRIRIRKRIRIKKKPSAKKKVRKIAEKAFWVLIIIGFITSLIVMIVQLDIKDDKFKKQRPTKSKSAY